MKKLLKIILLTIIIIPCGIMFVGCGKANPKAILVELKSDSVYEFVDNKITIEYGSKVEFDAEDFVVKLKMSKGKNKEIQLKTQNKNGFEFSSNIPSDEITPIGIYKITFSYEKLTNVEIIVEVVKATIDVNAFIWNYSNPFIYDKNYKEITLLNVPNCVSVSYENNKQKFANNYKAVATLTLTDIEHYNPLEKTVFECDWKIEKASFNISQANIKNVEYKDEFVNGEWVDKVQNVQYDLPTGVVPTITGETSKSEVGEYNIHCEFEYTLEDKDNYNPINGFDTTWKILPAEFTRIGTAPTLSENYDYTYNGQKRTVVVNYSCIDTENVKFLDASNLEKTNAGTYTVEVRLSYIGDNPNYNRVKSTLLTWQIKKAPLTVTAKEKTITYGDNPSNGEAEITGFVNSETESVLTGTLAYSYNYTVGNDVGDYDITPYGLIAVNYDIKYVSAKLKVEKKDITIIVNPSTIEYNQEARNNGFTAVGLIEGDTNAALGTPEYSYGEYSQGSSVGEYVITLSNLNPKNYNITSITKGKLIVVKANIDTSNVKILVDGKDPLSSYPVFKNAVFEMTVDSTTLPDGVSATVTEKNGKVIKNAGLYTALITFSQAQNNPNYNNPQPIEITFQVARKVIQTAEELNLSMGDGKFTDHEQYYIEYKQDEGLLVREDDLKLVFDETFIGSGLLMPYIKLYSLNEKITKLYLQENYGGEKGREEYEQNGISGEIRYIGYYVLEVNFESSDNVVYDGGYYKLEFIYGYVNKKEETVTPYQMELACDLGCDFEFNEPDFFEADSFNTYYYIYNFECSNNGSDCGSHGIFVDLTGRFVYTGLEDKYGNLTNDIPGYYSKCDCDCHKKYM